MTKLAAYAIAAIVAILGAWYGVDRIAGAFRDRDALQTKVADMEKDRADLVQDLHEARAATERQKADAEAAARDHARELALREDVNRNAAARSAAIQKELSDAKRNLELWRRKAEPDLARCLDVVVPDFVVGLPGVATATGAGSGVHPDRSD